LTDILKSLHQLPSFRASELPSFRASELPSFQRQQPQRVALRLLAYWEWG